MEGGSGKAHNTVVSTVVQKMELEPTSPTGITEVSTSLTGAGLANVTANSTTSTKLIPAIATTQNFEEKTQSVNIDIDQVSTVAGTPVPVLAGSAATAATSREDTSVTPESGSLKEVFGERRDGMLEKCRKVEMKGSSTGSPTAPTGLVMPWLMTHLEEAPGSLTVCVTRKVSKYLGVQV